MLRAATTTVGDIAWRVSPFSYRRAIVRALPSDFAAKAIRFHKGAVISQERAAEQHAAYVAALKRVVPEVILLPAAEGCPDSVFVEDTAVCVGDTALITRPGAESRLGETAAVEKALRDLGMHVAVAPAHARLDGGDVLFTGSEIFVGISSRTNQAGVTAVAAAFPDIPVTPVVMSGTFAGASTHNRTRRRNASVRRQMLVDRAAGAAAAGPSAASAGGKAAAGKAPKAADNDKAAAAASESSTSCCGGAHEGHEHVHFHNLHLKSSVSMVGHNTVAVADTPTGHALAEALLFASKRAEKRFHEPLRFLLAPDAAAANAIIANGTLLHRAGSEFPETAAAFLDYLESEGLPVKRGAGSAAAAAAAGERISHIGVDMSEFAKADGALTCCSLLLH